ncbi:MAG: Fur family transcriptional regulator [Candidatus Limnocylindrales bacterium]
MTDHETIEDAFDRAGYRLTRPRRDVAGLIAAQTGHFTAGDLLAEARARRLPIGRATVFRALELLTTLHVVERLDLPTGEHAYVPCEPIHHHHLLCERCGRSVEIRDGRLADAVDEIGRATGFRIDSHRVELFGTCPSCLAGSRS